MAGALRATRSAAAMAWLAIALLLAAGCGAPPPITACEAEGALVPICGFDDPEDLAVLEGGWLVASEAGPPRGGDGPPGRLLGYRPGDDVRRPLYPENGSDEAAEQVGDTACAGPPDAALFSPHGVDLSDDGTRLAVVNHGGREAVELFEVGASEAGPALVWRGCVPLPGDAFGNDLVIDSEGGLLVANMMASGPGLGAQLRMALGRDTGHLIHWSRADGWRDVPGTSAAGPNGVELSPDGRTAFFTAWGAGTLVRVGLDGSDRRELDVGARGDNLSWDSRGRLLVPAQRVGLPELVACVSRESGTCAIEFVVWAVDSETLDYDVLIDHAPARVFGAASAVVELDDALWLGTFGGDRLLRFTPDEGEGALP